MRQKFSSFLFLLFCTYGLQAEVRLPAILSDNMCLQADKPIRIWGAADAGEKVTVSLSGLSGEATGDDKGNWQVTLPMLHSTKEAMTMTVSGKNTLHISNILVGSVWIGSGQSNMEMGVRAEYQGSETIAKCKNPKIRLFIVKKAVAFEPLNEVSIIDDETDFAGKWVECSPEVIGRGGWFGFSAVAYHFGAELQARIDQPIGLIESSWGGTPISSWVSERAITNHPTLNRYLQWLIGPRNGWSGELAKYEKAKFDFPALHQKWEEECGKAYQETLKKWDEQVKQAQESKTSPPPRPQPTIPEPKLNEPKLSQNMPAGLFNAMIAPLIRYPIQGVLWYQGESNTNEPIEYREWLPTLIADWRTQWGLGDFPFLIVQLANFKSRSTYPGGSDWALLREAQSLTIDKVPQTGLATIIDLGAATNIHPGDKKDVGQRLCLNALKLAFQRTVINSGPRFATALVEGNKIRIRFKEIGGGLKIGGPPSDIKGLDYSIPADTIKGFAVAGSEMIYRWANATIDGDSVLVSSEEVPAPLTVRYAWADNPECNLYNREGLPAVPFRTDEWPRTVDPVPSPNGNGVGICENRIKEAHGQCEVMFIGDSITQGFQDQATKTWELVGGPIWEAKIAPRHALDFGVASDATQHAIWRLDYMDVHNLHPKVVVVMLGMNNASYPVEETVLGIKAVILRIKRYYPQARIVAMSITANHRMPDKTPKINEAIRAMADNQTIYYLDLFSLMTPENGGWKGLGHDGVHLKPEAYEMWADALNPLLDQLLK